MDVDTTVTGLCLIELGNGSYVLGKDPTMMDFDLEVTKPLRLMPRQNSNGQIVLSLVPFIPFMAKEKQDVDFVRLERAQVLTVLKLKEVLKDGGELEEAYESYFSSILRVSSLQSVKM